MRLTVTLGELMGHRVWNAATEVLEVPIGVSGGGFGPLRIPVSLPLLCCVWPFAVLFYAEMRCGVTGSPVPS